MQKKDIDREQLAVRATLLASCTQPEESPPSQSQQDTVPQNATKVRVNLKSLPGSHPYTMPVKVDPKTTVNDVLEIVRAKFMPESEEILWLANATLKAKVTKGSMLLPLATLLKDINFANTTLQDYEFSLDHFVRDLQALVMFDKKQKNYKVVLPRLLQSCMSLCFMRVIQVSKDMTAADLMALIYKTHQTKPYTNPPPAFLVVQLSEGDGPPAKLSDGVVLSSLYKTTQTLDYEVKQFPKAAEAPAQSPSPAKKQKAAAAPPATTPSPAKKPARISPTKKANGKK